MVGDHLLAELLDFLVFGHFLCQFAGINIDSVGGDDDAGNLGVVGRCGLGECRSCGQRKQAGNDAAGDFHHGKNSFRVVN